MGKPLGLGSFQISVKAVREIDRKARYARLFAESGEIETGVMEATDTADRYRQCFAGWYLYGDPERTAPAEALWQDTRLKELRALLTLANLPAQWNDITRYLEFGKLASGPLAGNIYNEYQHFGYPPNRVLEKRRPLPPATQVLDAGPAIPKDGRPDCHHDPLRVEPFEFALLDAPKDILRAVPAEAHVQHRHVTEDPIPCGRPVDDVRCRRRSTKANSNLSLS
jgi:hypothetical protein